MCVLLGRHVLHRPENHPARGAGANLITTDWSLDGKWIVYTKTSSAAGFDIWVWPPDGDANAKPQLAVHTARNAMHGRLSPNGRWLAYASISLVLNWTALLHRN